MSPANDPGPDARRSSLGAAAAWLIVGLFVAIAGLALNDVFILVAGVLVVAYAILGGWPHLMSRSDGR